MCRIIKLWSKITVISVVISGVLLSSYAGFLQATGNFHVVIPGELYRSAQPTSAKLTEYCEQYNIRTIINLRGPNQGKPWYDTEVATARRFNIRHIDFHMSTRHELTLKKAKRLVAILGKAQKPVLIHCRSGADRTGLASALYLAAIAKHGEEVAEKQLSFRYGHVPIPGTAAYPMDRCWERMESWLGFSDS